MFKLALVLLKKILDGIFDRDDAEGQRLIESLQQSAHGGTLALTRRSRHDHEPARLLNQVRNRGWQLQVLQFEHVLGHHPEGKRLFALLFAEIGPIAHLFAQEA